MAAHIAPQTAPGSAPDGRAAGQDIRHGSKISPPSLMHVTHAYLLPPCRNEGEQPMKQQTRLLTEACTRSTSSVMPSVDSTFDAACLCFCLRVASTHQCSTVLGLQHDVSSSSPSASHDAHHSPRETLSSLRAARFARRIFRSVHLNGVCQYLTPSAVPLWAHHDAGCCQHW